MSGLTRRSFGILAASSALIAPRARAEQVTLRIASNGGDFAQFEDRYLTARFTAETGIQVVRVANNPPNQVQKLIASRGRAIPFDVAGLDDKTQPEAIEAGVLAKIDPKIVTNLAMLYDQAKQPEGYGPAELFWSWGLMYQCQSLPGAWDIGA